MISTASWTDGARTMTLVGTLLPTGTARPFRRPPQVRVSAAGPVFATREAVEWRLDGGRQSLAVRVLNTPGFVDDALAPVRETLPDPRDRALLTMIVYGATRHRLTLDALANAAGGPRISAPGSRVGAWVIPTDEELVIARHARRVLARD